MEFKLKLGAVEYVEFKYSLEQKFSWGSRIYGVKYINNSMMGIVTLISKFMFLIYIKC